MKTPRKIPVHPSLIRPLLLAGAERELVLVNVVVIAALFLKAPPAGWLPGTWRKRGGEEVKKRQSAVDFTSGQMAATPHFWLMYVMMAMVATGGLMAVAQLNPMAVDFKVDKIPVSFLWLTMPALTFALSADRLVNGLCRPFWGWVSDHIGRENTMFIAFTLEAVAVFALLQLISRPVWFIALSGLCFFGLPGMQVAYHGRYLPSRDNRPFRSHVKSAQQARAEPGRARGPARSARKSSAVC